ncbi:GH1 family beta-glucosidase [Angustibacter peucedani]
MSDPGLLAADFPTFPDDFVWGAATASYQVEGAVDEGGRGRSVWDTFCAEPGRVRDGSSGAVACDQYHRYAEDVALLRDLGAGAYRFSVAWPRVQPDGSGPANAEGLGYYDRLVDELLAAGVASFATLFHWDLPQALEDRGGWLERDTAERFGDYASLCADRLGDRVAMWAPVNEPNVVMTLGYAVGAHAPGRTLGFEVLPVAHHLLLAHGLGVQALRAGGARSVGTATNHTPVHAATDDQADVDAAGLYDLLWNRLFAEPVLLGEYPEGMADAMPGPVADDVRLVGAPLDFYGVNYYNPTRIAASGSVALQGVDVDPAFAGMPFAMAPVPADEVTGFGWPVVPDGLHEQLVGLRDRYGDRLPQVFVTENGCSFPDVPDADGQVDDVRRIAFYDGHLRAVRRAMDDGVDVGGYFAWSLLDNFE